MNPIVCGFLALSLLATVAVARIGYLAKQGRRGPTLHKPADHPASAQAGEPPAPPASVAPVVKLLDPYDETTLTVAAPIRRPTETSSP